ncbi:hypothetical protein So717_42520 [Roseobacter cerasinus]|uniref:VPLPA-CTERM protein sorting domain-containing protein n=1 Tax=Roseobacter cerasinus TaxID=2602289 RepID=A0A640VWU7_9RHOB|nr:VPLPA-CTERM sorting domain-containing protein [Roseobacter cerasinus]GFE52499.1 hypothetical protein So717_42520 [Roseobacter cerasinus]
MSVSFKSFCLAAGVTAASTMGASAALLDFTAGPDATGQFSDGDGGFITWEVTATGGTLNTNTPIDAELPLPAPGGVLALENDGVGVDDDEATAQDDQTLIVTFSEAILLTGLHFLDLFIGPQGGTESVSVFANGGINLTAGDPVEASDDIGVAPDNGYAFRSFSDIEITSLTFIPGDATDDTTGDFALAAIEYELVDDQMDPVPLPAGGFLLLGALGALSVARRRKKA